MRRLDPGDQLGRYKILKRLGAGAMGEVYLAEDPQIGRQIALKTVRVEEGRANEHAKDSPEEVKPAQHVDVQPHRRSTLRFCPVPF